MLSPQTLNVSEPKSGVITIQLNRPKALNALNTQLLSELADMLEQYQAEDEIRVVVLTGSEKAFAAGADIHEMAKLDTVGVLNDPRVLHWQRISRFRKPIIAAVNGYALGGGCELAMHADIIIAADNALFGQPEIKLGIMPGAGGTQRLIRAVGKSLATQMVLTGEPINAQQALSAGLVAEVTIPENTLIRAQTIAYQIAQKAPLAVELARDALHQAMETNLNAGLLYERKNFTLLAATEDRHEGINAFMEKRIPEFQGK